VAFSFGEVVLDAIVSALLASADRGPVETWKAEALVRTERSGSSSNPRPLPIGAVTQNRLQTIRSTADKPAAG